MITYSVFDRKYVFEQFFPKYQNCQFELKFGIQINLNVQNPIGGFYFFYFRLEKPFLGKSAPKNQNCQFNQKFGTQANLNMRNSMIMSTFSVFVHKHSSSTNLFQKFQKSCLFKVKFYTKTNPNIQNSMVVSVLCFTLEIPTPF